MSKKYDSYKDSGIEWIGEIPSHWNTKRLKFIGNLYSGLSGKSGADFSSEASSNTKPFINFTNVANNKYIVSDNFGHVIMTDNENQNQVQKGDLLFLMSSENQEEVGKSALLNNDFGELYLNSFCKGLRISNLDIYPNFLNYLLNSSTLSQLVSIEGRGFTRINLRMEGVQNLPVFFPDKDEQITIANYLDQKTTQIEDLIAKKERLIQLLEEERTAIINQAVTKGLDPTVPMKDSGIEWLGEIPAHWEVKRIKYIGKIISGYSFKSEDFTQTGVRVMKISNIQTMRVDWTDDSYLPENFLTEYERFKINKGDLVFALTRPIISTGIKATIVNEQEKILLNQRNAVLKSGDKLNVRWMYYMIFNEKFKEHFESLIDGTGQQPNISSNDIANINIPLPELNEQNEIVQFLDSKMENVETIISKYQKEIELLKEYKTALISEVVTGKVDVRNEKCN